MDRINYLLQLERYKESRKINRIKTKNIKDHWVLFVEACNEHKKSIGFQPIDAEIISDIETQQEASGISNSKAFHWIVRIIS